MVKIGEDVSEQLDVEPARFFVHRHIRAQYACHPCETVTAAPTPSAVIDGGMAAVGLLAWIAASKYLDHLPLYRIEQIAARHAVPLARSTLAADSAGADNAKFGDDSLSADGGVDAEAEIAAFRNRRSSGS